MKAFVSFLCGLVAMGELAAVQPPFQIHTVTNLADGGPGSLRQILSDAEPGDQIRFSSALNGGTITLTNRLVPIRELVIDKEIFINGPGATNLAIAGSGSRVFRVDASGSARISGLTIRTGRVLGTNGTIVRPGQQGAGSSGEDAEGGGILNHGSLGLVDCVLRENSVKGGDAGWTQGGFLGNAGNGSGGAIANRGTLSLIRCILQNNCATGGIGPTAILFKAPDGGMASGGAIANHGDLTLLKCTLSANICTGGQGGLANEGETNSREAGAGGAGRGGAIWSEGGNLTLLHSTLNHNRAIGGPGGPAVSTNSPGPSGPGIGGAISSHGPLVMTSCTVSGNIAWCGERVPFIGPGGDAYGGGLATFHSLQLTACTVAYNDCLAIAGGDADGGGLWVGDGPATVHNSIIAGGRSSETSNVYRDSDVGGQQVVSLGRNLVGVVDGGSGWIFGSDQWGFAPDNQLNPLLGPLRDNGGSTFTMALLPGSPAIDAGDDGLFQTLATDQRGCPRQTGLHIDIGAYEAGTWPVMNTNDNGPGSLRYGVINAPLGDAIIFAESVINTIVLTNGEIDLLDNRTIIGPPWGVSISGGNSSRIFDVGPNVVATIRNLTIRDGLVDGNLAAEPAGGGIIVHKGGTLTLEGCTLVNNRVIASQPNGSGGAVANLGTLTVHKCTLFGNSISGSGSGGALYNEGTMSVQSCTITENGFPLSSTVEWGGALYQLPNVGATSVRNTIIAGNNAFQGPNVSGHFQSLGYNLVGNAAGSTGFENPTDQLPGVILPFLGPLQNNGGPNFTCALVPGSLPVDKGIWEGLKTDQRGLPRPVDWGSIPNASGGDGSDIGAFELQLTSVDIGLRMHDGSGVVRIAVEPPGSLRSPLRIAKNGVTYGIVLTDPNAPDASRMRVRTLSGIKAWAKLP